MSEEHVHDEHCDHDHDEDGIVLISVKLVGEHLHCALNADDFEEPGTWGVVFADIARNLAETCATKELSTEQVLKAIRENFLEALDAKDE